MNQSNTTDPITLEISLGEMLNPQERSLQLQQALERVRTGEQSLELVLGLKGPAIEMTASALRHDPLLGVVQHKPGDPVLLTHREQRIAYVVNPETFDRLVALAVKAMDKPEADQ